MTNRWEIKKLDEVCKEIFAGGDAPKGNFSVNKTDKYPIPIIANAVRDNGLYGYTDLSRVNEPSITIAARGSGTGHTEIRYEPFFPIVRLIVLTPNTKMIVLEYLKFAIQNLDILSNGSAIPQLTIPMISEYSIPLPGIILQKRIVSIVEEAFAAIATAKANAEQNIKNVKELFESYLLGVFENKGEGWVNSTIGDTCNLHTGGTPSTSKSEYYNGGDIKWLVSGDINQKVIHDCEGRITELGMNSSNARYLPVNSVLIALNGQGKTRGTVAMLRTKATCNQSLVSIYPKDIKSLLPELVFSNLEGRYEEIRKITGDSGNDRRGLNMPLIRSIRFSYPKKITEQQDIITKLDALRTETQKLEAIYQQKIAGLEELKKSILQKAFSGELKTLQPA